MLWIIPTSPDREKKTPSALLIKPSQSPGFRAKVSSPLMTQSPWDLSGKTATNSAKRLKIYQGLTCASCVHGPLFLALELKREWECSLWHMTAWLFTGNGKWCEFIWGVAKQKWPNPLWNHYNNRQLKDPLFNDPKNILRSMQLQPRLLGACVQLSVCLTTICSCWPTFSLCLNFYSPQAAVSRSQRCWCNNQYCSHFNSLAAEKAKFNLEVCLCCLSCNFITIIKL